MNAATARRRIAAHSELNAFISLSEEDGRGPAVGVKDVVDVTGMVTTGGGSILPLDPAKEDAGCVVALRGSGAWVVGKTNLHEWAFGPTSSNPHFGAVRNPRDPFRIPGGSSGGSAAAVAAGLCDWAIGTDTGGSVRMPSALCGVVGMKPTLGLVSTEGVIPLAPTLDTVGPLAPDVRTTALALEMMTGRTGLAPRPPHGSPRSYRLAVPRGWVADLDADTARSWNLVHEGLPDADVPERERFAEVFTTICGYEASRFHEAWLERCPERYGEDVRDRLRQGLAIGPEEYRAALAGRDRLRDELAAAMATLDALVLPATACTAPLLDAPDRREALTRYLRPASVTGHPAVVLPVPTPDLPVGIQLVGRMGEDAALLGLAAAVERAWQHDGVEGWR